MAYLRRPFKLFEYALVALLIAGLLYVVSGYYQKLIEGSQLAAAKLQAAQFSRSVELVKVYWQLASKPTGAFERSGLVYTVNAEGMVLAVAGVDARRTDFSGFTEQSCQKMFHRLIYAPLSANLVSSDKKISEPFGTSDVQGLKRPEGASGGRVTVQAQALPGAGCRYFVQFGADAWYFDYLPELGQVSAVSAVN